MKNPFKSLGRLFEEKDKAVPVDEASLKPINLGIPQIETVIIHGRTITYDYNSQYVDGDGNVYSYNTDGIYERSRDNPSGGDDNPHRSAPMGWIKEHHK